MVSEMVQSVDSPHIQPKACYAAFTFGLKHRWTYFLSTLPDIEDLLERLENTTSLVLIHTFAFQCPNTVK